MISFPCYANKRPKIKEWQKLSVSVAHSPDEPYGILCGKVNNILIIDCDKVKDSDARKFLDGVEVWKSLTLENQYTPNTLVVKTPSGGLHVYFRYRNDIITGVAPLNDSIIGGKGERRVKIDILSDNRFVMAYDSQGYKTVSGSVDSIGDMPEWLVNMLTPTNGNLKNRAMSKRKREETESGGIRHLQSKITKEKLSEIVSSLDSQLANNRDSWCKVLWAIKSTSDENGFDGLDIADAFSKNSPEKYKGIDDVRKTYEQGNGSVRLNTLKYLALTRTENLDKLSGHLQQRFPELDVHHVISVDAATKFGECVINYTTKSDNESKKSLVLLLDMLMLLMLPDREYCGSFTNEVPIDGDLTFVDSTFSGKCTGSLESEKCVKFRHTDSTTNENSFFSLMNPRSSKSSYIRRKNGPPLLSIKQVKMLRQVLRSSCHQFLDSTFGNIFNQINIYGYDPDENIRADKEFIDCLEIAYPNLRESFRSINKVGIYGCNEETHIWKLLATYDVESRLIDLLETFVLMNDDEGKRIKSKRCIRDLRSFFCAVISDDNFLSSLDSKLDVFAFQNCLLSFENISNPLLRDIKWNDFIHTTCGWSYSSEMSEKYMPDVRNFFFSVLPRQEEREFVSHFFARLLCGKRTEKHFLVLTDKRAGNNGKTTMMTLMQRVFGNYSMSGSKIVCQGNFASDRNTHDAGLYSLKGKRLVVADELKKHMTLDCGWLKAATGGEYIVRGRHIFSQETFEYVFAGKFVLIFNENDHPKFDASDDAFRGRMVICPFRSKFVKTLPQTYLEENTFVANPDINDNFFLWRSAVVDYLREYFLKDVEIPQSMQTWTDELCDSNDEFANWFDENTTESDNKNDFISFRDLTESIKKSISNIDRRDLKGSWKKWASRHQLQFYDSYKPRINGKQVHFRNCVLGIRLNFP